MVTATRSSLEISDEMRRLGASHGSGSNLDVSSVSMSALKENLAESLDLFADVILNPAFPPSDFNRVQQLQIVGIQQEKVQPRTLALRLFPRLLYGEGHAYSLPFTGSGDEASVAALTPADLATYHETWFKPGNATLIVVGDVTREEIEPLLADKFSDWACARRQRSTSSTGRTPNSRSSSPATWRRRATTTPRWPSAP